MNIHIFIVTFASNLSQLEARLLIMSLSITGKTLTCNEDTPINHFYYVFIQCIHFQRFHHTAFPE